MQGAVGSHLHPKLLGTYEQELHPLLEQLRQHPVDVAFDIGAAEGYYAVGMLFAGLASRVVAFETNPAGQALVMDMARLNGVADRLSVFGACTRGGFERATRVAGDRSSLLMMDVGRFRIAACWIRSGCRRCRQQNILVEVHDFVLPGLTQEILARFGDSHTVERIRRTAAPAGRKHVPVRRGSPLAAAISDVALQRASSVPDALAAAVAAPTGGIDRSDSGNQPQMASSISSSS